MMSAKKRRTKAKEQTKKAPAIKPEPTPEPIQEAPTPILRHVTIRIPVVEAPNAHPFEHVQVGRFESRLHTQHGQALRAIQFGLQATGATEKRWRGIARPVASGAGAIRYLLDLVADALESGDSQGAAT